MATLFPTAMASQLRALLDAVCAAATSGAGSAASGSREALRQTQKAVQSIVPALRANGANAGVGAHVVVQVRVVIFRGNWPKALENGGLFSMDALIKLMCRGDSCWTHFFSFLYSLGMWSAVGYFACSVCRSALTVDVSSDDAVLRFVCPIHQQGVFVVFGSRMASEFLLLVPGFFHNAMDNALDLDRSLWKPSAKLPSTLAALFSEVSSTHWGRTLWRYYPRCCYSERLHPPILPPPTLLGPKIRLSRRSLFTRRCTALERNLRSERALLLGPRCLPLPRCLLRCPHGTFYTVSCITRSSPYPNYEIKPNRSQTIDIDALPSRARDGRSGRVCVARDFISYVACLHRPHDGLTSMFHF